MTSPPPLQKKMKSRKASGLEGISLEMLSLGGEVTICWLKSIFDTIWATESVPEEWQSQILVPLHKKGIAIPTATTTVVLFF